MKFRVRRSAPIAVTSSSPSLVASFASPGTESSALVGQAPSPVAAADPFHPAVGSGGGGLPPVRRKSEPLPPSKQPTYYKQRTSLPQRRQEVHDIQCKFPGKVMIILERYRKEKQLAVMDRIKFLVPRDITLSQFVTIIRNRMQLQRSQAIYFLVGERAIGSMAVTMNELHQQYSDPDDGFLYIKYASQETFG